MIGDMTPTWVPKATTEANERIRAFMAARAGRALWPEEQAEYEQLLTAWADSLHAGPDPR
ncbi:hypothetical protein SAZ_40725 [Streptomyces noursei ZPM]|uniref:Uncharacterized protein n=2 Tax=Streptomyces noursei TaxID=1971 RepID=A0A059W9X4_STRNR|nr:hypothetical protein DC74_7890 [Streptomyces noursei]AKA07987.1 hypothetical protein SAZ_40725 [Streptomyces noursei ZPM]EOS97309.1 hypothetical protein K530_44625 [Streptomyces noursei CCRC 11814]EXU90122.1 hypothetical protein P354_18025 [Streptomyces noursei PD-1]GCB87672.1 hypothetical protein SALB_00341 [Streptomyces noursei]